MKYTPTPSPPNSPHLERIGPDVVFERLSDFADAVVVGVDEPVEERRRSAHLFLAALHSGLQVGLRCQALARLPLEEEKEEEEEEGGGRGERRKREEHVGTEESFM